jgi:complement component 1 Q subcomponent-binding protein
VAPEDQIEDTEALDLEGENAPYPARVNITVTKPGKDGALLIEAVAQNQEIFIDSMYFFEDKAYAEPKTYNAEWKRRGVYAGPPFSQLDGEVQSMMEQYLQEKGVNEEMAAFVSDYVDFKEQNEYVRWLKSKSFSRLSKQPG